jgi:hypothetical protein
VGGGSAIDTAKAVAHGAANPNTDIWQFWLREAVLAQSLPVGVVLTISAAGSETSTSAVLTNEETATKRGLGTDFNRPAFAVMNPELTFSLPKYQIACGIADILMHTMDRFFSRPPARNDTTDEIAGAVLRVVIENGRIAIKNPADYHAMSEIMWCGSLSHNGITGLGYAPDFAVHQIAHELGGRFNEAHGATLTTVWASWARHVLEIDPARFARFAALVWGVNDGEQGIGMFESYFREIGMPTCFTELGVGLQGEQVIEELAERCTFYGKRMVGSFKPLGKEDLADIYRRANR